jgi:hypothetical protein
MNDRSVLDAFRSLGTPEELEARAATQHGPASPLKANAHVHVPPNFSAFDSVRQAVTLASGQEVRVLGLSNYYDFTVYTDFSELCRQHAIFPLYGLEIIGLLDDLKSAGLLINDPGNPGRMYLCGKGISCFDPMTAEAGRLMQETRRNDNARMKDMVDRIEGVFAKHCLATGLDDAAIIERIKRRYGVRRESVCLQERHVAQAFQEAFFQRVDPARRHELLCTVFNAPSKANPEDPIAVQQEIRSQLMKVGKPAFVPEVFLDFEQANRLILELEGIPCYPTLADGAAPICPFEDPPEKLIQELKRRGIHCAELIPIRNQPAVLERYVSAFRQAGLIVTAGTEHNTFDLLPMEPACVGGQPIPEPIRRIFWEGTCVVAAHQFLALHGRTGYVDRSGNLNDAFSDHEHRIEHFRKIGAAVIASYMEQNKAPGVLPTHD